MKRPSIFICLLVIANSICAQTKLTLEDCTELALKNNLQIQGDVLEVERNRLLKNKAAFNNLPTLNLSASQDYEFGFTIEPTTNRRTNADFVSSDFSLRSSFDIIDLAKLKAYGKASTDYEKSLVDYEINKNQLLLTVAQYYLDVMFRTEYVQILKNQLSESENQINRLNEALSFGYIAKSELYDAQADYSIDQKAVLLAENNKKRAILSLLNLINYDQSIEDVEFFDILFQVDTTRVSDSYIYVGEALRNNPRMISAEYGVESAKKNVGINKANGLPSLRLSYQFGSFYVKGIDEEDAPSFEDQINDNQAQFIGGTLRVPIFNALQNNHNIKIAKVDHEKARINEKFIANQLKFEVEQTIQDIDNAISAYQTSLNVLNAARESFRTSRLKYEQGKISAFDFSIAKRNLLQTEFDLLDSKFKLYFSRTKLDFLTKRDFRL